jgi:galactokinase
MTSEIRASASGRVNLIGEHTDYNEGFVLPTAIPQRTDVVLRVREDDEVHAASDSEGSAPVFRIGQEERTGGWTDYVAGVTWALARRGHRVPAGFDLTVSSRVPLGAGCPRARRWRWRSGRAVREAFGLEVSDEELAAIGREAENGLVGVQTGPMDQLAAALTTPGEALLIDCRTLESTTVRLPDGCELVVIDSGVRHSLSDGSYDERRSECARAVELLGSSPCATWSPGTRGSPTCPDPWTAAPATSWRRTRGSSRPSRRSRPTPSRTSAGCSTSSHASQRDLYEVSVPQVDRLVELAREHGALGARLTGGGFGGSVLALARAGEGAEVGERTHAAYTAEHPRARGRPRPRPPGDGG